MQEIASVEMPVFDDAKGYSDEVSFPTMQETASVEMLVFGGAKGCSDEDFVSDGAGVGRSAPLHPLGGRGARGLRPSRALPGLL